MIAAKLPDHYAARLDEQIRLVDVPAEDARDFRPDISLTRTPVGPSLGESAGGIALIEPTDILPLGETSLEEVRVLRIDLYRWPSEELVATIELLSPWNKTGDGYGEFQRKRRSILSRGVNWVEIDFLVGGERVPFGRPSVRTDYRVVVARWSMRPNGEFYSWNVRQPLPMIPIPLRQPDHSIPIALVEVFDMTYERTRLEKSLRKLSSLPLRDFANVEDSDWARELALKR